MMRVGELDVSRETYEKLVAFQGLIEKWTAKINLVSKSSIPDIWDRHIVDSVQVFANAPTGSHWVDLGSGGGLPGLVVAILTRDLPNPHRITLVESDQRKATFLRTANRELGLDAVVLSERIEMLDPLNADILSARALADLSDLLEHASHHLAETGTALFPKGAQWQKEVQEACKTWSFSCEAITSRTNPQAAILKIKDIQRV